MKTQVMFKAVGRDRSASRGRYDTHNETVAEANYWKFFIMFPFQSICLYKIQICINKVKRREKPCSSAK